MDQHFETLWNDFSTELLGYIKSKVKNIHDAEDILQEVYLKIYRKIDQLEEQSLVKSWIYTITRNTIIDFYRKRKDISVSPETLHFIEDDSLEDEENMNDVIALWLKDMVFDLPEKYKQVYDMYEYKNMKHSEIMEELDISLSASKVRLSRAKDIFRKNLLECCHFEVDKYGNVLDYHRRSEESTGFNCTPDDRDC